MLSRRQSQISEDPAARSRLSLACASALAALLAGCGGGGPPGPGDAAPDAGPAPFLERLETSADFTRLAGEGWAVKYLAPVAGKKAPSPLDRGCVFQNTARYPLHLAFLRSFAELAHIDWDS